METQGTENVEHVEVNEPIENPPVEEIQNVDGSEENPDTLQVEGEEESNLNTEEYVPDTKFRVLNSEKEFDDFILSAIKNKDDEQRVRDLYERAYGIDHVKEDRQALRDENTTMRQELEEFGTVKTELQKVGHLLRNGDLDSFFEMHGLTEQQVVDHLLRKEKLQKNPAALQQYNMQRQQIAQGFDQQLSQQQMQEQMQQQQQFIADQIVQQRNVELNMRLNAPDLAEQVRAYDARMGKDGAFSEAVKQHGAMHWHQTKQDLPVEQAVEYIARMAGFSLGQGNYNQPTQTQVLPNQARGGQPASNTSQQSQQRVQVLPNVNGSGATAVRKIPRSIDDIRAIAQSMNA